jgi:hypothetical protein
MLELIHGGVRSVARRLDIEQATRVALRWQRQRGRPGDGEPTELVDLPRQGSNALAMLQTADQDANGITNHDRVYRSQIGFDGKL